MRQRKGWSRRRQERGQTIILVAISLISLLAMAALAIDVVTLYAARSETQRAADAAALAGAKAVADSGFTTLPTTDTNYAAAQTLAQTMATNAVNAMLSANPVINQVSGIQPALVGTPTITFPASANPANSNPQITVTLQVTTLPTFFAKIWGNRTATVTASAIAEAYNPANVQSFTQIAPKGVKPWYIANNDPGTTALTPFITPATGAIEPGVIGKTFNLTADCAAHPRNSCTLNDSPPTAHNATNQIDYVPAQVTFNVNDICPSVASCTEDPRYPDYQYSVQCSDVNPYPCGGSVNNTTWDKTVNPRGGNGPSALGAECLIHAASGQDLLQNPGPWPSDPFEFKAQSGPQSGYALTTSSSVVTIPIIDPTTFQVDAPLGVTVIGFMQAFINQVQDGTGGTNPGDINVTVLNIAACSSTPKGGNAVVGQGTSPVPVRLITPP
ncbi:MAG: pilus assembly protein TadG-related protein [Terriglobales bacterium]